jgi:hypothetical protein
VLLRASSRRLFRRGRGRAARLAQLRVLILQALHEHDVRDGRVRRWVALRGDRGAVHGLQPLHDLLRGAISTAEAA